MNIPEHIKEHKTLGLVENPLGNSLRAVWYRQRHTSGVIQSDALGNGPNITEAGTTAGIWANDGWFTAAGDNYARVRNDAYLASLFNLTNLVSSGGVLFFSADIYPQSATPANTQPIFHWGCGAGTGFTSLTLTQHITTGIGRVRIADTLTSFSVAETAQLTVGARNSLSGYVDFTAGVVAVTLNGGAYVLGSSVVAEDWAFDDAAASNYGLILHALNPTTAAGAAPTIFMTNTTRDTGLFICRFDTHPGTDILNRLARDFAATQGFFPTELFAGRY